jgi:uncharacterized Rmd1/YagE family protein
MRTCISVFSSQCPPRSRSDCPLPDCGQCTAYKDGLNVVVHCLHHNADEDSDSHAFYFMYGSIVLWNFDRREEGRLIAETRSLFSRGTLDDPEAEDFGERAAGVARTI